MSSHSLAKTPLHDRHEALGASIGPFAGYAMPIVYSGIAAEHGSVRAACGIFDVSHMGRLRFRGEAGATALQRLTTIHVPAVAPGTAHYGLVLNDDAGIIDDVFLYVLSDDDRLLIVNASNRSAVLARLDELGLRGDVEDETESTGMLAVQGPAARDLFGKVASADLPDPANRVTSVPYNGGSLLVATTGYTGEDGVEVIGPNDAIVMLWDRLTGAGAVPVGLGARDTLRLEVAYPLHGHELSQEVHPKQGRATWAVDKRNEDFAGRDAYLARADETFPKLVGLETVGRGIPRAEQNVEAGGAVVGQTTSGTFSPSLKKGVALAYVSQEYSAPGTEVEIVPENAPNRRVAARVVKLPFYRDGSRRSSEA